MSFLNHIQNCNQHDFSRFHPWRIDGIHIGWIRHDHLPWLDSFNSIFAIDKNGVSFQPFLTGLTARSQALGEICTHLAESGSFPKLTGEAFSVLPSWGETPLCLIDRAYASFFGIQSFGIHVNGLVYTDDGLKLWIAKRAQDRHVAPGKLDNIVAGGQPADLTLSENLCKEAAEEANIPSELANSARPVGVLSYTMEDHWGIKHDSLFCFDLEIPPDFTPRNTDGEVESFQLMGINSVINSVKNTQDFKFNVNLVLIDLFFRHGLLHPDSNLDYLSIAHGLRPSALSCSHGC